MDDLVCWPYWMPEPERSDYGYELSDQTVDRSEMDVGVLARRQFTTDETKISCNLILEDCEPYWFEAFERWVIDQGAEWFAMPLWVAGEKQHYICQMVDRPKMDEVRGFTNFVSFQVRVQKRILTPVSAYAVANIKMLPTWPEKLPVLQDGYSYEVRNTDCKTSAKLTSTRRPEWDVDECTLNAKFYLNRAELNLFEWFERDVLNNGARWFRIPLWIGGDMHTQIARFTERPKITLDNFWTSVETKMELENRAMMDKLLVAWLTLLSPEDMIYYSGIIQGVINGMGNLTVPDFWMPRTQCLGGKIRYEWGL